MGFREHYHRNNTSLRGTREGKGGHIGGSPRVTQLGTVGSRSIIKYGADVPISVAKVKTTSYVDIANFDRYDMIMGTPWMRRHKVLLDFDTNRVIINGMSIPAIKVLAKDLDIRARRHRITDRRKEE
jgi:hypothetical protein